MPPARHISSPADGRPHRNVWAVGVAVLALAGMCSSTAGASEPVSDLFMMTDAQSRSISPENPTGEKGGGSRATLENGSAAKEASELGTGWKVNPYIVIKPGQRFTLGETSGPGIINHIWLTAGAKPSYRSLILRIHWDNEPTPSIESPLGDFFAAGFGKDSTALIDSAMVTVNPESGLNSYWPMPFRRHFRIEIENRSDNPSEIYYQIDYSLTAVPPEAAYLHAQFRQVEQVKPKEVYTLLDGVRGRGHYVGTYLIHRALSPGWWGEGEFKFYLDGDTAYPTINYTGEEDYFLGSYGFRHRDDGGKLQETPFSSRYAGFHVFNRTDYATQYYLKDRERRIAEYRWHVPDPIRFRSDIRVTLQSLGWKSADRYKLLEDGYSSVAFWYQTEPHAQFPQMPDDAALAFKPLVEASGAPTAANAETMTIDSPVAVLIADDQARAILQRIIPVLLTHPALEQFQAMSLVQLQPVSDGAITDAMLSEIAKSLAQLKPSD